MLQKIRWTLLLVGVVVILIVSFQNSETVSLQLLFFQGEYPLTLLLLASSVASFLMGALTMLWKGRSRSKAAAAHSSKSQESPATTKDSVTTKDSAGPEMPLK